MPASAPPEKNTKPSSGNDVAGSSSDTLDAMRRQLQAEYRESLDRLKREKAERLAIQAADNAPRPRWTAMRSQRCADPHKKEFRRMRFRGAAVLLCLFVTISLLWNTVLRQPVLYHLAVEWQQQGRYTQAADLFLRLNDYQDASQRKRESSYQAAMQMLGKREYPQAARRMYRLGSYRQARTDIQRYMTGSVAIGLSHALAVKPSGQVKTGGESLYGQAAAAGERHSVGLRADGTVVAVGQTQAGACDVADWQGIVAIAAGSQHTVGLHRDGHVLVAGASTAGQAEVEDWSDIVSVAAGAFFTAGLRLDGSIVVAGRLGATQDPVLEETGIAAISAGPYQLIALKQDGSVLIKGRLSEGSFNSYLWHSIGAPTDDF